jgi:hypothetical protein
VLRLVEHKVVVHLSEEKSYDIKSWVLDTGATNHVSDACLALRS